MTSLRKSATTGILWSLFQSIGGRGITLIVTIVLARLLTPDIFGLIGMLTIFIQISQSLIVAGFNQALIQKKNADDTDFSSVFWINLIISLLLYLLLYLAAPFIAAFYGQEELTVLTRALSLVFVINAFGYVQEAKMTKEMRFKGLTIISMPSAVLGGVLSVVMALVGYGVWSIVALQLVTRLVFVLQIWFYTKWRPLFVIDHVKIKGLFSFGSKLMFSGILETLYQNIYLVVIGKFFSVSSVGYYQTAGTMVLVPSGTLSAAVNKVAFPAFSIIQDDNVRLKAGFRKIIQQLLLWLCPTFIFAGILAEPIFNFVFTEKWLPAVPYFQWLCIVGIFFPLNAYNLNIITVKGRTDLYLKLEVIKKIIIALGVISVIPFGIYGLLVFQAFGSVFAYLLNSYYSGRFIQYGLWEQIRDVIPIFLYSCLAAIFVYGLNHFMLKDAPNIIKIISGFIAGASIYIGLCKWTKLSPFLDLQELLKGKREGGKEAGSLK